MLVSVIVPTRNRPLLLKRALLGIREQTYRNFEVHVVDDSSNTDTNAMYSEIWQEFDGRFRLHTMGISSLKGFGPSVSRNYGISQAGGDIFAFCDDDDTWTDPFHLEILVNEFTANKHLDMYIANQQAINSAGIAQVNWLPGLTNLLSKRTATSSNGYLVSKADLCESGSFAHLNMTTIRKEVVEKINGFWERLSYEEDRDFFWRAVDVSRVVFYNPRTVAQHNIPDPKLQSNQSTLHNWVERWLISILVSQHICASVTTSQIADIAMRYEGDLLRKLTIHFNETGNLKAARQFAISALAARFSFKWAAYTALLFIKTSRLGST